MAKIDQKDIKPGMVFKKVGEKVTFTVTKEGSLYRAYGVLDEGKKMTREVSIWRKQLVDGKKWRLKAA